MILNLALLPLAFTSLNIQNNNYANVLTVNDNSYIGIIDTISFGRITYDNGYYLITNNEKTIYIKALQIKYVIFNDNLYLLKYNDNTLTLQTINKKLEIIDSYIIYKGSIDGEIYIVNDDINLYVTFTNNNGDIEIYTFGGRELRSLYGGSKLDKVEGLINTDDYLYMAIYKDSTSGGTFGYGGHDKAVVLAKIDKDLNVIDYITIDINNNIDKFIYQNGYIYLVINNKIYLFNEELKFIKSFAIEYDYLFIGKNDFLITIKSNTLKIYDRLLFNELLNTNIEYDQIKEFSDFLYLEKDGLGYYLDFLDFKKIRNFEKFDYYNNDNVIIESLYGRCSFKEIKYDTEFNKMIYGEYPFTIYMETPYNIEFSFDGKKDVALYTNVTNDMIYPVGYRLDFNGDAYLDGKKILMNHPVYDEGEHEFVINGLGSKTIIKFTINKDMMNFKEYSLVNSDLSVECDEIINLTYNCDGITSIDEIKEIKVNNTSIYSYDIINNKLNINLVGFSDVGEYNIGIDYIKYEKNINEVKMEFIYYLNERYIVNVKKSDIDISLINITDDYNFIFDCFDSGNMLRVINVEVINNKETINYYFPISKGKIILRDIGIGEYKCNVKTLFYNYSNEYKEVNLFNLDIESTNKDLYLGDINVNNKTDGINKFSISLDKENLNKNIKKVFVSKEEVIAVISKDVSTWIKVLYCIIGAVVCFGLALLINYLFHFKLKKRARW